MELTPFIAKAYHLQYDAATTSTQVNEGYFWTNDEVTPA
jgi:hypothetical protein